MKSVLVRFCALAAMLVGLPLFGVMLAGLPLARYLEFPPRSLYIPHAAFSWIAFTMISVFVLIALTPFVWRLIAIAFGRADHDEPPSSNLSVCARPFPWWGWVGLALTGVSWFLAWTRFAWFASLQPHTFTPLWIGYILTVNAMTHKRAGRCMMLHRPGFFLALFPASAAFWWFFEYLNRFVQNWHYIGGEDLRAWQYFWQATLPFATVLPAVLGTQEWLGTFPLCDRAFRRAASIPLVRSRFVGATVFLASTVGVAAIGVWPNQLYPLVWIAPLLIIVTFQMFRGERYILTEMGEGDWRLVGSSALAALICGFFWEMWNFYSLPKWEYSVPYVNRFHIFEMPILGYAGYLPFGLQCMAIGEILASLTNKPHSTDS